MTDRRETPDVSYLETILGYTFRDKSLLFEALTHKSYSHENDHEANYERLEFLGDAVLQLCITEYLLDKYKKYDEGLLSKLRGHFVSEPILSEIIREKNIGSMLLLGRGEILGGGERKDSILCDIFESLIGAVYYEGGLEAARSAVIALYGDKIKDDLSRDYFIDSKSELQKIVQKDFGSLPEYRTVSETGPEHLKVFTVQLKVAGLGKFTAEAKSKKLAEKAAAAKALEKLKK